MIYLRAATITTDGRNAETDLKLTFTTSASSHYVDETRFFAMLPEEYLIRLENWIALARTSKK